MPESQPEGELLLRRWRAERWLSPAFAMLCASCAIHLMLALWAVQIPTRQTRAPTLLWQEISPLQPEPARSLRDRRGPDAPAGAAIPEPGGRPSRENISGPGSARGAEAGGRAHVILLVDRAHDVLLRDSLLTADRDQIQRIRTSRERGSDENRRATPNPSYEPFLASGSGELRERRPLSARDPARGVPNLSAPSQEGAAQSGQARREECAGCEATALTAERPRGEEDERSEGSAHASPAQGALESGGRRRSRRANAAFGRPHVDEAPAATLAEEDGRPRDNLDSEHLAAQLVQSLVDASPSAGASDRGGSPNGGASGGDARPHLPGAGGEGALDTRSRRYRTWYLSLQRAVQQALQFPYARAAAMDQGLCVARIQVARDGALRGAQILRSSGFTDFDAEALRALRAASPFPAIPGDIAAGAASLEVDLTIQFQNPMIR